MRTLKALLSIAVVLHVGATAAQYTRDVVVVGNQRYVRTEQMGHTLGPIMAAGLTASAHAGTCAYVIENDSQASRVYLTHFDRWARVLHASVSVDPSASRYATGSNGARTDWGTWVVWYASYNQPPNTSWGRVFDASGVALTESFVVTTGLPNLGQTLAISAGPGRTIIALGTEGPSNGGTQGDIYARVYDASGNPLGPLVPVAVERDFDQRRATVAVLADGAALVTYGAKWMGDPYPKIHVRRVNPDLTVEAPVEVDATYAWDPYIRALSDGTALVTYWFARAPGAAVRRVGAYGRPVGQRVVVNPGFALAAATSDGRLVVGNWRGGEGARVQILDEQWLPLSPPFEFRTNNFPTASFSPYGAPLAYEDDGTIWIAWQYWPYQMLTQLKPFDPGDLNYDRKVNNFDIDPFVLALTNPDEYKKRFPGVPYEYIGDCNFDGLFNNFDIDPFVELLTK